MTANPDPGPATPASRFIPDLAAHIEPPADGTLSVTVHQDEHIKAVLFGFAKGQELSEHTAAVPAIMHQLRGKAQWIVDGTTHDAPAGAWCHMPAHTPHTVIAAEPCVMLLLLLKGAKASE